MIHKDRLKAKLKPYYWRLYDATLGRIASECRSEGVPIAVVIVPRVGPADSPAVRVEPVARLKALARHHGLTVFDLSDTFDGTDPTVLEIAAWDDHPNAAGHERLFKALAKALTADAALSQWLLPPKKGVLPGPGLGSQAGTGGPGAKPIPSRADGFAPRSEAGRDDEMTRSGRPG